MKKNIYIALSIFALTSSGCQTLSDINLTRQRLPRKVEVAYREILLSEQYYKFPPLAVNLNTDYGIDCALRMGPMLSSLGKPSALGYMEVVERYLGRLSGPRKKKAIQQLCDIGVTGALREKVWSFPEYLKIVDDSAKSFRTEVSDAYHLMRIREARKAAGIWKP